MTKINNSTYKKDDNIINAIDDFDYSTQKEDYNKNFRNWRRKKDNPYAFNLEINKKECIFNESRGFVGSSATEVEKNSLSNNMFIFGIAMLIFIAADTLLGRILAHVLSLFGVNVHMNFFGSLFYGGSSEIVAVIITCATMKYLIPVFYLHKKLKMPLKVEFMSTVNGSIEIIEAIGLSLIASTITCLPSAYSSETKEVYTYFKNTDMDISIWSQQEYIIYTIFDIIILSILTELLFRGAIFNSLRQFGDAFAIITTSIISGFIVGEFLEMPAAILISIVASVGMLRSGTIFTAFFVRIIFKMYQLALIIIGGSSSPNMFYIRNITMIVIFLIGVAIIIAVRFTGGRRFKNYFAKYNSEISLNRRISFSLKSFPISVIILICILEAIIALTI